MNFTKGILESRVQTYKHLRNLLKTIPVETPATIELAPGNEVRVTLFDANHCVGAVMFLIQGNNKAILYTGDIRSEPWWVNSIVQNPVLLPYTSGSRRLDRIYLDTTFASKADPYRQFPSKADGLRELLEKVDHYPKDTIFYLEAWTFGYENVWVALSNFLQSPIHLDKYRWSIYRSLSATRDSLECREAPPLTGFRLGNHSKTGCLTSDSDVRLHSCERGNPCPMMDANEEVVWIVPIISRLTNGVEMHEMGIGGGKGDLDQVHELEVNDAAALGSLLHLCAIKIENRAEFMSVCAMLTSAFGSEKTRLRFELDVEEARVEDEDMTLDQLVGILLKLAKDKKEVLIASQVVPEAAPCSKPLPRTITFPYSRHSSYSELCALVEAFQPRDVYPCTVDERTWDTSVSMRTLFGHLCSADIFAHDRVMMSILEQRSQSPETHIPAEPMTSPRGPTESQETQPHQSSQYYTPKGPAEVVQKLSQGGSSQLLNSSPVLSQQLWESQPASCQRVTGSPHGAAEINTQSTDDGERPVNRSIKEWAYLAATGLEETCESWNAFGGLVCVRAGEQEVELGESTSG
jgi:DNA cross-link repair 1C protein